VLLFRSLMSHCALACRGS